MRTEFFSFKGSNEMYESWDIFELHLIDAMMRNSVSEMDYMIFKVDENDEKDLVVCKKTYRSVYKNSQHKPA